MPPDSPLIRIDLSRPEPAYEQIVAALRGLLVARELVPGDTLPPVRQLAVDLAVHFNTVAQAYRILADEGWLDLRQGRGATVIARPAASAGPGDRAAVSTDIDRLVSSALARGINPEEIRRELERVLRRFSAQSQ